MRLDNHFATLPDTFYTRLAAQGLTAPYWVAWSESSARLLDLPSPPDDVLLPALAGNATLPGSQPLAAVYSGHQFGSWAGQLGDGRALLLGDAAGVDGQRWELQLKGAGKTPYSRMGDGRAVLRSSIREFLCSEAMAGLGIPTTRALSIVGSDQPVIREAVETAAIVTRLSPSFVRFGNFEHFYSTGQHAELKQLADYVIERFYPSAVESAPDGPGAESDGQRPNRYAEFLRLVTDRTARLIAQWQAVGFCHGVMNTDNMSILGLTLDYGPFGFLDGFDSGHVCNHSDHQGRYAYSMQPRVGEWNCFRLGQALMPLIDSVEVAQAMLATYQRSFAEEYEARFRAKLGLRDAHSDDTDLLNRLFSILEQGRVDFTLFFRNLSAVRQADRSGDTACRDLFIDRQAFDDWAESYRQRLRSEGRDDAQRAAAMNKVNPKYVLRNHLAELAIQLARGSDELTRLRAPRGDALGGGQDEMEAGGLGSGRRGGQDFSEVARLARVLARPFDDQPEFEHYAALPPDWSRGLEVSCSS